MTTATTIQTTDELTERITRLADARLEFNRTAREGLIVTICDTPELPAEQLATKVNGIADAEGQAALWARAVKVAEFSVRGGYDLAGTIHQLRSMTFDLLADGADDSWSGRTNDARRARFDGTRRAGTELRRLLDSVDA